MRIFRSFEEAAIIKNPVVTTGSFDGVHVGHKTILDRLKVLAERHGGESVLITFDPHPRKVLYPQTAGKDLKMINSQEEKIWLLDHAGLDNVIVIGFTKEFSKITSEEFVRDFLHGILKAKVIVAGFNHHFGFNQQGDYRQLWALQEKYHFEAEEIPEQEVQNESVSSTRIRQALKEGYIQRANAYLDHYYMVIGRIINFSLSEGSGFPELKDIEITEECKLLPSPGIYAVSCECRGKSFSGMALSVNGESNRGKILLHAIECCNPAENERIIIFFHKKIFGKVNLSDEKASERVNRSLGEIAELIY